MLILFCTAKCGSGKYQYCNRQSCGSRYCGGIAAGKERGLGIPVVWNSSGYESTDALDMLDGLVDGWLPDLKTLNTDIAVRCLRLPIIRAPQKRQSKNGADISACVRWFQTKKRLSGRASLCRV
ncbi:hypothetical protein [Treponema phagedenis]|uniref:hypothetical protein n=1 Tax=Treponema phagedenis TaxID=162 RepID=UPI002091B223|nr:hypothetical protein [Treponema phagedenis]